MGRARSFSLLTTAFAAFACSGSSVLFVGPPDPNTSSLVVFYLQEGAWQPYALDTRGADWKLETLSREVRAMTFSETLDELGLAPGPVEPELDRPCTVTRPAGAYVLSESSGDRLYWTVEAVDGQLLDLLASDRKSNCVDCTPFVVRETTLAEDDTVGNVTGSVFLPDERLLLGLEDRKLRVVGRDEPVRILDQCPEDDYGAFGLVSSGAYWLVGDVMARSLDIDLETGACSINSEVQVSNVSNLVGAGSTLDEQGPPEMFILTSSGAFFRFDGATATHLGDVSDAPSRDRADAASLVRTRPNAALFSLGDERVFRYESGELTPWVPGSATPLDFISAIHVSVFGTLVATKDRIIHRMNPDGFEQFLEPPDLVQVAAIRDYRDGLIVFQKGGTFRKWAPGLGFCPQEGLHGGDNRAPRQIYRTKNGFVVADGVNVGRTEVPPTLQWLDEE